MYSSNNGILFENNVHKQLKKTKYQVYTQIDIMNIYGSHITEIDYMIVLEYGCLCIQDKYSKRSINVAQTTHFMQTVNILSQIINSPCIGIYLSYNKLSGQKNNAFVENNHINNFIEINAYTEKELINNLTEYLYSIQVFMYDNQGDCIMLS